MCPDLRKKQQEFRYASGNCMRHIDSLPLCLTVSVSVSVTEAHQKDMGHAGRRLYN
jgi:hypothetical protein